MCPRSLQGWVLLEELLGAGLRCIVSPAVTSQVDGMSLIPILGHSLSPVRQRRGGRAVGGWCAQDFVCRGDVPVGHAPLGMRAGVPA